MEGSENPPKYLKCGLCNHLVKDTDRLDLIDHFRSAHSIVGDSFICDQCPYEASHAEKLKEHVKCAHSRTKAHGCEQCEYATSTEELLRRHVREAHLMVKDHICGECGRAYTQRGFLNQHLKKVHLKGVGSHMKNDHSKVKSGQTYSCEQCGKSFSVKWYLEQHIKSYHLNAPENVCQHCGVTFLGRTALKNHTKAVHLKIRDETLQMDCLLIQNSNILLTCC